MNCSGWVVLTGNPKSCRIWILLPSSSTVLCNPNQANPKKQIHSGTDFKKVIFFCKNLTLALLLVLSKTQTGKENLVVVKNFRTRNKRSFSTKILQQSFSFFTNQNETRVGASGESDDEHEEEENALVLVWDFCDFFYFFSWNLDFFENSFCKTRFLVNTAFENC